MAAPMALKYFVKNLSRRRYCFLFEAIFCGKIGDEKNQSLQFTTAKKRRSPSHNFFCT
jgi:hypothetical protein